MYFNRILIVIKVSFYNTFEMYENDHKHEHRQTLKQVKHIIFLVESFLVVLK